VGIQCAGHELKPSPYANTESVTGGWAANHKPPPDYSEGPVPEVRFPAVVSGFARKNLTAGDHTLLGVGGMCGLYIVSSVADDVTRFKFVATTRAVHTSFLLDLKRERYPSSVLQCKKIVLVYSPSTNADPYVSSDLLFIDMDNVYWKLDMWRSIRLLRENRVPSPMVVLARIDNFMQKNVLPDANWDYRGDGPALTTVVAFELFHNVAPILSEILPSTRAVAGVATLYGALADLITRYPDSPATESAFTGAGRILMEHFAKRVTKLRDCDVPHRWLASTMDNSTTTAMKAVQQRHGAVTFVVDLIASLSTRAVHRARVEKLLVEMKDVLGLNEKLETVMVDTLLRLGHAPSLYHMLTSRVRGNEEKLNVVEAKKFLEKPGLPAYLVFSVLLSCGPGVTVEGLLGVSHNTNKGIVQSWLTSAGAVATSSMKNECLLKLRASSVASVWVYCWCMWHRQQKDCPVAAAASIAQYV